MRALACLLLALTLNAADFPQADITNGPIKAKLNLPDAEKGYYRATRFDWSGGIASLEYKGHNYFGVWFPRYDPKVHDSITGPVEEFRTGDSALGYAEAKAGGTFIRIGVGLLRKPDDSPFQQFKTYDIVEPGKWIVHAKADSVEFLQDLTDPSSGYSYRYRKVVRLVKGQPRMVIEHSLKNTGKKSIETNVYNHQFFVIDGQPSGPEFAVKFPFDVKAGPDMRGPAEMRGNQIVYLQELQPGGRQSVFSTLSGFGDSAKDFDIRVENKKVGAGVRVVGDKPLSKMVFWSIRNTLCPEAYIDMKIEPGREFKWNLTYDFYTL